GNGERLVERVVQVEERDGVRLAPRDRLAADAHEERPLGELEVVLVDPERDLAVAAEARVGLILVLLAGIDGLVAAGDGGSGRVSLGDAPLERAERADVLTGAVVVDAVVEAPEREPEGELVEREGLVARELRVELRVQEVPLLDDLERRDRRPRLRL